MKIIYRDARSLFSEIDSICPIHVSVSPTKWVEDSYWELKPMQQTQTDKASEQFFGKSPLDLFHPLCNFNF